MFFWNEFSTKVWKQKTLDIFCFRPYFSKQKNWVIKRRVFLLVSFFCLKISNKKNAVLFRRFRYCFLFFLCFWIFPIVEKLIPLSQKKKTRSTPIYVKCFWKIKNILVKLFWLGKNVVGVLQGQRPPPQKKTKTQLTPIHAKIFIWVWGYQRVWL